jgi:hypothetical protein
MTQDTHVYRPSSSASLSETVVHAVAETKGVDPLELDERLYDCINPDALDVLFEPTAECRGSRSGMVVFSMDGCRVEIESDRTILVTPTDEETPSAEAHV